MRTKFLLALTAINFFLLIALLAQTLGLARAESEAPVLRGRGLQIVDEQGRVRASISVLPATPSKDGIVEGEAVLLRLITERGRRQSSSVHRSKSQVLVLPVPVVLRTRMPFSSRAMKPAFFVFEARMARNRWSSRRWSLVPPNHAFNRTRRYGLRLSRAAVAAGRLTWSCWASCRSGMRTGVFSAI
jgi:hypothetical protein